MKTFLYRAPYHRRFSMWSQEAHPTYREVVHNSLYSVPMSTRLLQIKLPENLIREIQANIQGTSFKSVEDFVETLVKQRFHEIEQPIYTAEEEELIKDRLRKLGSLE